MPAVGGPVGTRKYVRPGVYLGIITVLLLISAVALQEARSFEEAYTAQRRRDLEDQLAQLVEDAEGRLVAERFRPVFAEMAAVDELDGLEVRARRDPLIDALYVWDRDEMVFPAASPEADLAALRANPCMRIAAPNDAGAVPDPQLAADGYSRCFAQPDPQLWLFAASEAAELLINADQPAAADEITWRNPLLRTTPLVMAHMRGLDVRLLASLQLQRARAMNAAGASGLAQQWLVDLAREISDLDGPDLERTLDFTEYPIPQDLREYRGPELPVDVEESLSRAHRRLEAWRVIQGDPIGGPGTPTLGEFPRVIVDPLDDPPWVVLISRLGMGELSGAIQIDQAELVRDLLAHSTTRNLRYLSIRDASGHVLGGSSEDLAVDATFPRLFPNLRAGFSLSAVPSASQTRTAFITRLAPFGMAIAIGFAALLALIRTDRQQELLLDRQRDFVARVSHELKTPLAGIRVMAENLEIGAFRGDEQRQLFARRIVQEAERLTARVNEVIRAATRPQDDVPVATDLDALVGEVLSAWRPRFEAAHVQFHVDVLPLGTAAVMPALLRDALVNLLDNALKYRKAEVGGRIWLRARPAGRQFVFEVEDDGLGVPPKQRRSIFDRFRRVEGPGRGKSGGHGLGLSFVAETARLHAGKVECLDGTDGGSKFVLRIRRRV